MVRNCNAGKMETTFYEDYSYGQPVSRDRDTLKRSMTLDLNPGRNAKKSKMEPGLLTQSAGVNFVDISTPELEKLIIGNEGLASATALPTTPSSFLFPKGVTEAQENYVQPFVQLLSSLHQSDSSSQGPAGAEAPLCADEPSSYTSLDSQYSSGFAMSPSDTSSTNTVVIKDEPQTVPNIPCSPPVSPIDMECQEKIKLERKRQRNRVAASKCRKRKLERIALLEEKVKSLKGENAELIQVVHRLKDQVYHLKEQVVDHANSGCHILSQSL